MRRLFPILCLLLITFSPALASSTPVPAGTITSVPCVTGANTVSASDNDVLYLYQGGTLIAKSAPINIHNAQTLTLGPVSVGYTGYGAAVNITTSTAGSYTLAVSDFDAAQQFEWYFTVAGSSGSGSLSAPTGVTASGSASTLFLSWTGNGAASYNIYRGTSSGGETLLKNWTSAQYSDSTVAVCTTYYMYVTAVSSNGSESAHSAEVSASLQSSQGCTPSGGGTTPTGGGTTTAAPQSGLTAALVWANNALTISYTGQDSFVQCSWPGGSYTAGDGSTLTAPSAHVLSPTPPVGSSVTIFGRNTMPQVLVVQDNPDAKAPDNTTTTVGGDGYVPTPKHDPGGLKIGFGKLGSISIPSGWWTEVIQFASQAAMEASGMTGPQIAASMQLQTNQVVKDADYNAEDNRADADHNTGVIQTTLTGFQSAVNNVVTTTEKTVVADITSMNTSLFQPDPTVLQQFQTSQSRFLDWGPYHFIANFKQVLTQPANDPTGGLSIPVMSVHVNDGLALSGTGQTLQFGTAGQWYDTGQRVPFDFTPITKTSLWPFVRGLEGAAVWLTFAISLIWYLFPKQTV